MPKKISRRENRGPIGLLVVGVVILLAALVLAEGGIDMTFDPASLQSVSLLAFILVFLGGVVTSLGPCNVATIPLIVGYVGGSHNLPRSRPGAAGWAGAGCLEAGCRIE